MPRNQGGKTDEHITNKYVAKTVIDNISGSWLVMADLTTRRAASSRVDGRVSIRARRQRSRVPVCSNSDSQFSGQFAHLMTPSPQPPYQLCRSNSLLSCHPHYSSVGMSGLTTHLSVAATCRTHHGDPPSRLRREPQSVPSGKVRARDFGCAPCRPQRRRVTDVPLTCRQSSQVTGDLPRERVLR